MDSIGLDEEDYRRTSSSEASSSQGYNLDEVCPAVSRDSRQSNPKSRLMSTPQWWGSGARMKP